MSSIPIPEGIKNKPQWRKHCRKIHARAKDLLNGRLGVIETARALCPLAFWTQVENKPDFRLFRAIASETDDLPVGTVRENWAPHALAREDARIQAAEAAWRDQALEAAARLVDRYKWAVERVSTDPHQTQVGRIA